MIDTRVSRRQMLALTGMTAGTVALGMPRLAFAADVNFRYGHMNTPTSVMGQQADWLAQEVAKNTGGKVGIEVFPSSQLGSIKELAEGVSAGTIALSHNTAGALSSLYEPVAALDTPYLYNNVDHLMKVVDANSPVMKSLSDGLVQNAGVRILYAFYFGARQLTCNKAVRSPADLAGVKIRAIPSPIYLTAVEGLGAVPVPVDWSEVPTALATGVVAGQENPVTVILDNKLYEVQSHLMLTAHIRAAELVVINEDAWQALTPDLQAGVTAAADTVRRRATKATQDLEATAIQGLKDAGMTVIGPEEGLDVDAFRKSVGANVKKNFGDKWGDIYKQIASMA